MDIAKRITELREEAGENRKLFHILRRTRNGSSYRIIAAHPIK